MPKYDYKCQVCGGMQEFERQIGENHEPVCCSQTMNRIYSATPALFKAPGFYSTGG